MTSRCKFFLRIKLMLLFRKGIFADCSVAAVMSRSGTVAALNADFK